MATNKQLPPQIAVHSVEPVENPIRHFVCEQEHYRVIWNAHTFEGEIPSPKGSYYNTYTADQVHYYTRTGYWKPA